MYTCIHTHARTRSRMCNIYIYMHIYISIMSFAESSLSFANPYLLAFFSCANYALSVYLFSLIVAARVLGFPSLRFSVLGNSTVSITAHCQGATSREEKKKNTTRCQYRSCTGSTLKFYEKTRLFRVQVASLCLSSRIFTDENSVGEQNGIDSFC